MACIMPAFPPLPRLPAPPRLPFDVRHERTARVISSLAAEVTSAAQTAGPNFATGFYASAVNAGKLQATLERGLSRFSIEQRDARWKDKIFPWILRVLATWVQRRKHVAIERVDDGIHIELETQDDLGYYRYMFDVFPLRELRKARR